MLDLYDREQFGTESGCGKLRKLCASSTTSFEVDQIAALLNDIEQIAMFASGCVGPFSNHTSSRFGLIKTHEHRPARCIAHIADQLITALVLAWPLEE